MASLGADYSWARPGGAALRAAGVTAVGRYLATDGRGITAAEYQDLQAHGIGVWLVREGSASGMLNGYAQGVADAQVAVQQIAAAGLPADSLVYAAADWDVSDAQFGACDNYLAGFASVLGRNRTGIYGGLHYLNHVHSVGLAVGFWQAGATSWDHGEAPQMPINFHQTTLTPPLPGTDHNYINDLTTIAGSGATPLEGDMPLTKDDINLLLNYPAFDKGPSISTVLKRTSTVYDAMFSGGPSMPDQQRSVGQSLDVIVQGVEKLEGAAGFDAQAIAAAVVAALPAGAAPDTTAIVKAIESALADQIAALPSAVVAAEGKALSNG